MRAFLAELTRIEAHPRRGASLSGNLSGLRSARVGNRQWRIVYAEQDGRVFVLAIGSRSDAAVYASAAKRLAALRSDHPAQDLSSILDAIAGPEPDSPPR
jgi:mRNA-degrading endonuclease RelE of RelBE toxin-antitoxin system